MKYIALLLSFVALYVVLVTHRVDTAEIRRLEVVRDSLALVAQVTDTVYDVDTIYLTRTRTQTDSILTTQVVWVRDEVVEIIDQERAACDAVILTCEERVADRDKQILNLDSLLTEERKGTDWKTKLGWLLAGAAAGSLIPR